MNLFFIPREDNPIFFAIKYISSLSLSLSFKYKIIFFLFFLFLKHT